MTPVPSGAIVSAVGGPGWWTVSLVVVVIAASVGCLGHLALARRHRRRALDVVDVGMGAAMLAMLVGLPLGRGVAWVTLLAFAAVAVATTAGPALVALRGGVAVAGARPAVLCAAMTVMLLPAAAGRTHVMAGAGSGLVVSAAVAATAVLVVGGLDVVTLSRRPAREDRLPTLCRLAMGVVAAVMLVELIH